jgi:hypothetical protein
MHKNYFISCLANNTFESSSDKRARSPHIKDHITDTNIVREMLVSIRYDTLLYDIIYASAGWRVMTHGYMHDHQLSSFNLTELHDAIMDYDLCWARYKAFGLTSQFSASLYRGVYFNLPGGTPEPGLDAIQLINIEICK